MCAVDRREVYDQLSGTCLRDGAVDPGVGVPIRQDTAGTADRGDTTPLRDDKVAAERATAQLGTANVRGRTYYN